MKLNRLYIENFGGLHQYALDFESDLTVIRKENGFGKSTLAEFIRAMFYGFPRKGKTLDKSRRQKYTPWNGGTFGGNLEFEADGNRYRVERTFGATPKGDSFILIDLTTGRKSNRYGEELGLELFQLDGDSFERSTYLPQLSDGQTLTTDSIRSKLSNLVEDTNDVGNFEKAMAALKAKRGTYVAYRGSGGSVAQATAQVTRLQDQLQRAESQRETLDLTEEAIYAVTRQAKELESRREAVRQEIRSASEAAAVAAVHSQHRHLEARLNRTRAERRDLEAKYPAGIPAWEEIEKARQEAARLEILNSRTVTEQEDLDAAAFVAKNRSRFENRIPTPERLASCRETCEQVSDIRERSMELAVKLTRQPDAKPNVLPLMLCLILAAAGAAAGIVLENIVLLGIAVLMLIGGLVAAVRLSAARKQLRQFQTEQAEIHEEMDRLSADAEELTGQIEAFLIPYGFVAGADFFGSLAELEHDSEDYRQATVRIARWHQEKQAYEAEVAQCEAALAAFFGRYTLIAQADVRAQLLQIRDDRKQLEELLRDENREAAELEAFKQEHGSVLNRSMPETGADLPTLHREEAELSRQQNERSQELLRLQQRKELLSEQVRQIPQMQDELHFWQEKKAADQKNADLLDDTMALLEQAKENLSGSYLGPIRRSFEGYLNRLWDEQAGNILVTPDLDVQLERYGQARELGYFSAGQTDTVMLCMRLALVDALFAEEKPFVILDDPFINLDDARTKEALELLKNLAQDRQILYLTCNSSRAPQ